MHKLIFFIIFLLASNLAFSQGIQSWRIKKIINLADAKGRIERDTSYDETISEINRSRFVYKKGEMLSFSREFSKYEWYDDSILIGKKI